MCHGRLDLTTSLVVIGFRVYDWDSRPTSKRERESESFEFCCAICPIFCRWGVCSFSALDLSMRARLEQFVLRMGPMRMRQLGLVPKLTDFGMQDTSDAQYKR